jgi:histone-lysine N-methyltransferase ASH1L
VYNLSKLSGTDGHGKRRAKGDSVGEKRRRTISGDTLVNDDQESASGSTDVLLGPNRAGTAGVSKKSKENSAAAQVARRATRLSGAPPETLATKLSTLGKRGKKTFEKSLSRMSRELRRLQDTNEFAHIETRPVRYTVWSNGKYIDVDPENPEPLASPPRKKAKLNDQATAASEPGAKDGEEAAKADAEAPSPKKRRVKKYLEKGLYAGQDAPTDISKGMTAKEKKKLAAVPELMSPGKPNKALPFPIFNGLRLLLNGRDFKLPYDVCNPLPPGQPKPAAYRTMTKSEPLPLSPRPVGCMLTRC